MTLKAKISFALAFLFAIILLLGGLGAYYLTQLADDSQAILQDNYISLEYVGNMQRALADLRNQPNSRSPDSDALGDFETNLKKFEVNLKKQETNVTEAGEQEATTAVRSSGCGPGRAPTPPPLAVLNRPCFRLITSTGRPSSAKTKWPNKPPKTRCSIWRPLGRCAY